MAQIGVDRESFRPSYRPAKPAPGFDPDMKRMGMVAAGIGGAIVLLFGANMALRHRQHGIPVIEAEAGPVRIKPENAGGMQVTGADFNLGAGTAQTLAPSAEQPQINALKAQLHAVKKELERQAAETAQVAKLAEAGAARAKAAEAGAAKVKLADAGAPPIVAAPPVERASATARIAEPVPAAPEAAVAPAQPAAAKPVAGPSVQLAAFTDAAAAQAGWDALMKKAPDLLGGRAPEIVKAQAAGRVMWRLRTAGFGTVAEAANFCARMRDHGADCSIAAF
jgi:hypothetical protein